MELLSGFGTWSHNRSQLGDGAPVKSYRLKTDTKWSS